MTNKEIETIMKVLFQKIVYMTDEEVYILLDGNLSMGQISELKKIASKKC